MKKALITGITGQDGSYLAELLLDKGYQVHGMVRRSSTESFERIAHIQEQLHLHQADLLDQLSIIEMMQQIVPDEVYNLAAQSFVPTSWKQPVLTANLPPLAYSHARSDSHRRGDDYSLLPGIEQRDVRQGSGGPRRRKRRPSIPAVPTASPRSMAIASRSITAKATVCTVRTASSSIMRPSAAARSS